MDKLCSFLTTALLIPALVLRHILLIIIARQVVVGTFIIISEPKITAAIIIFLQMSAPTAAPEDTVAVTKLIM